MTSAAPDHDEDTTLDELVERLERAAEPGPGQDSLI